MEAALQIPAQWVLRSETRTYISADTRLASCERIWGEAKHRQYRPSELDSLVISDATGQLFVESTFPKGEGQDTVGVL